MDKKLCLITGGTAGIGKESAIQLAKKGFQIVINARTDEKGSAAVSEIKEQSGSNDVAYLTADLSSQKEVKELAQRFKSQYNHLDVLLNNAGAFFTERKYSVDNIEMQFATNHLAYFLLTNLLLGHLKKSAPARIINVASRAHRRGQIHFDDINLEKKKYDGITAYAQSKLANVLFTYELADRLKNDNITVNCLHPGGVSTNIAFNNSSGLYRWIWALAKPLLTTVEEGAKTSIYLASSDEVKGVTGKYFSKCKMEKSSKLSYDKELGKRLWKFSEELTGLS